MNCQYCHKEILADSDKLEFVNEQNGENIDMYYHVDCYHKYLLNDD